MGRAIQNIDVGKRFRAVGPWRDHLVADEGGDLVVARIAENQFAVLSLDTFNRFYDPPEMSGVLILSKAEEEVFVQLESYLQRAELPHA